ncbi:hypothetical protein BACCIP111895_01972 [Neobacillus rhizosphaerae]|uniref:Uncharacterized protein n=1 Tax=Neobacillus rhizosphaerae TaxID=2880965 RepID=A0ABN8KML2_9BACI|nr:hypothetical protein [Neobacillus rhizosphaerae]CAH2714796.1 hypothetical protein BACCIP111895_01972 [Neobacillus rhizosphaerae]
MADNKNKDQRRKNMLAIRSQSKLENIVSRELWKGGFRFRKNNKSLIGKPDISIKKYNIVYLLIPVSGTVTLFNLICQKVIKTFGKKSLNVIKDGTKR